MRIVRAYRGVWSSQTESLTTSSTAVTVDDPATGPSEDARLVVQVRTVRRAVLYLLPEPEPIRWLEGREYKEIRMWVES